MTAVAVGSLCTGIAGLEHGLTLAGLDINTVFVSDIDKGACTWLEANVSAPNLGDFTALDELPPVDILTAGFPCQPLSTAGKRKGVEDDRWLWDDIQRLVGRMESRPLVFLENVPGLLTANDGHAMARVVHGLARIGYSISWGTMAAADVGAPHRRLRWWGLAYPADASSLGWQPRPLPRTSESPSIRRHGPRDDRRAVTANADRLAARRDSGATCSPQEQKRRQPQDSDRSRDGGRLAVFGPYAAAVDRWQVVTGGPAPAPDVGGRLSPHFVEWMMGYPAGWVTDALTNRRQALHALGNAVVPQCAAAAFTALAARVDDQAADGRSQTPAARSLTRW